MSEEADSVRIEVTWNTRWAYLGNGRFANYRLPRDVPEFEFRTVTHPSDQL